MAALYDNPALVAPARTLCREEADGSLVLSSPEALGAYDRCIGDWLERWAAETPDTLAFAERDASGAWRRVRWGELRRHVGAIAQRLLDLQLPRDRPVLVLSDNSIDHAMLMLAALHVGLPFCPVSSAYSRLTSDPTKIRGIVHTLQLSLVKWGRNERGKIVIEKKEALQRRGISSPDYADALMLSFVDPPREAKTETKTVIGMY